MNLKFLFFLLLLLPVTFAQVEDLKQELLLHQNQLLGQTIPSPLNIIFGNERLVIYLNLSNGGQEYLSIITQNDVVTYFNLSILENPTLNVYTTEIVVRDIINSTDPLARFSQALDNDEITYESPHVTTSIKMWFVNLFLTIWNWF